MTWDNAIRQLGAEQMKHARSLLESRPFLSRIPDASLIIENPVATSVPGAGRYRFVATRDTDATYAMIYAPIGRTFRVKTSILSGTKLNAWWFNPRNGQSISLGTFENEATREFTPPDEGEMIDWVLVLDDASKGYPEPGKKANRNGRD
jgi:hypothetical protein